MKWQIEIIGSILILLALVHVIFPKYFDWPVELPRLSLINRQMMQVHTLFVAFTVFLMGTLCLTSAQEIIGDPLGHRIALGFSVFWGLRLVIQFFGYSPVLWRGKVFETIVHILFIILWAYLSLIFALVAVS